MSDPAAGRRASPWRRLAAPGAVPPPRSLLRWLYVGRLCIAGGVFVAAALNWWAADLTQLLVASVSMTAAMVVTALSFWYTHLRVGDISTTFLYAEAVFDLGLVTGIVYATGPDSSFAALYILVIAINAVMMPFANGLLIALTAGVLYAAVAVFGHPVDLSAALLFQVGVYWLVAITTGYLSSRVRVAGAAQEALTAELVRVRLEAGDILRNIKTGILTVGGDGRLLYANPTAQMLLDLPTAAIEGWPVLDHLAHVAPIIAESVRRTQLDGRRVLRQEGLAQVDGRTFPVGISTTAVYAAAGETPSVTAIFKDISDEKRLESLHLRTERLEAVAEIAASLAHEIKNPLASIRSAVEQLARSAPPGDDARVLGALVLRESDRLSTLLSEFMDFSRVRMANPAPIDLVAVAETGIALARRHPDCPADAKIVLRAASRPVPIEGDEDLLHRVVFNLVLNAVQAAPAAPRVTVEIAAAPLTSLPPGVAIDAPRVLRVEDAGPGVPPDVLPRLFEPFVTGRSGGTGLGLAIVQRAVQAHRGIILCDSVPGVGTTFTAYIPARFGAEDSV